MLQKNIIDILSERGFIDAITDEALRNAANSPLKVYSGFDPTADSLHLGSMVPLMGLAWFQRCGHTPVAIVGGATGMIGDPSGKSAERQLLDEPAIKKNIVGVTKNILSVLTASEQGCLEIEHVKNQAIILNNLDWFSGISFVNFLRDVGKYFRIGPMLAKESVKLRMQSEEGLSFTEFSYQVLQGYDFHHLFKQYGVSVQIGGSDQWGNITAGTELIRKVDGMTAYGITFPLLVRSDGQKFGKSEKGSIWLSADRCSPYEFYQYLIRMPDADVIRLMKLLTFMNMEEIGQIELEMTKADYIPNRAQKRLAEEVTRIVHGEKGLEIALKVTEGASPGSATLLDASVLENIAEDMPNYQCSMNEVIGHKLIDLLVKVELLHSKSDARRLIRNGGVYVNNKKIIDENVEIHDNDLIDGCLLLLSAGKKNKVLVRLN